MALYSIMNIYMHAYISYVLIYTRTHTYRGMQSSLHPAWLWARLRSHSWNCWMQEKYMKSLGRQMRTGAGRCSHQRDQWYHSKWTYFSNRSPQCGGSPQDRGTQGWGQGQGIARCPSATLCPLSHVLLPNVRTFLWAPGHTFAKLLLDPIDPEGER